MTSPFSCSRCQGVQVKDSLSPTGEVELQTPIDKAGLEGLYIFYWVALTGWCWFSVWSALPDKEQQAQRGSCHCRWRWWGSGSHASADSEAPDSEVVPESSSAAAAGKQGSDQRQGSSGVSGEAKTLDDGLHPTEACWKCGAALTRAAA
jgi:hypothetical protein